MMLNGLPEVNRASRAGLRAAAELGSSQWPKRRNLSGLSGRPGNALQSVGDDAQRLVLLPEQQDLRLGADDRIGGGEAALETARLGDGAPLIALGAHHRQPDQRGGEEGDAADEGSRCDRPRAEQRQGQRAAEGNPGREDEHAGKARRDESGELA